MAKCELYKEERDVLERKMWDLNEGGVKSSDVFDSSEKTMYTVGDRQKLYIYGSHRGRDRTGIRHV